MIQGNLLFTDNASQELRNFLDRKTYTKIAVLSDENTGKHCYPIIQMNLPDHIRIQVQSGEMHKNLDTCAEIWNQLSEERFDRHAVMIIVGGGVLCDMGGFCAAAYKRGIDLILLPTTLLAQADASIGGKTGIDFTNLKNHIGIFRQPALTLIDPGFLKTLPASELRSGFAEIIKHALIFDKYLWEEISNKSLQGQPWKRLIQHSIAYKSSVITLDPGEDGLRKILNAGHTIGHALETHMLTNGFRIRHGNAVALGLIAEGYIAHKRKRLTESELGSISSYILSVFGKVKLHDRHIEKVAQLTLQDKKNRSNRILCVLLKGIGKAEWDCEINVEEIKDALAYYQSLQG